MKKAVTFILLVCAVICITSHGLVRSSFSKFRSGSVSPSASADQDELIADFKENVMDTYGRYPLTIDYGSGCNLFTTDGKKYLDFAAGIATCCLGHANPALQKAVSDQMGRVNHVSNLYYIPEQGKLAKWLTTNSCAEKVFFCNSGAEANEAAIKLARKNAHLNLGIDYPVVITALQSFHGRTLTTITATGQQKYQKYFGPLTPGFEYVKYNDLEDLERLVKTINSSGNGHGVAAIMLESLQGEGGIIPGDPSFFHGVRKICDDTGALMVMDEVQTGVGRTGKMWGYENLGVTPDVFTSAKALGGGVPIGCMCATNKASVFEPGDHASTYGGNPLACAAGLTVASAFDNDDLLANVQERGAQFTKLADALQKKFPTVIKEVRGWGLIQGIEISEECALSAGDIAGALMDAGLLIVPAGPKVVRFVPPLIVTEQEITDAMVKVEAAFNLLL